MEQTIPKMLRAVAAEFPETAAQRSRTADGDFEATSYRELYQAALDFGAALMDIGVQRGQLVGLIADDRKEWLWADMGIMGIGAIDVPRGCDVTLIDLEKILSFTECSLVVTENSTQVHKLLSLHDALPALKRIIVFDEIKDDVAQSAAAADIELYPFDQMIARGKKYRIEHKDAVETEFDKGQWHDTACIIFTSGTTGTPKGVELTYCNFLTQLDEIPERIFLNPGDNALCVLPVWHVFQRECEYVILFQAATICYSKPIGSILLGDFKKLHPQLMPAVPRVYEAIYDGIHTKMRKTGGIVYALFTFFLTIAVLHSRISRILFRRNCRFKSDYIGLMWVVLVIPWLVLFPLKWLGNAIVFRKIKAMLGNNFRAGISGGGAYPKVIDEFFWAIGINIVEGYGLTETAPIISVRPIADPIFGNVGTPIRGVKVRVVDSEGYVLGRCKEGVLQVKGATVMKGYYKRPDLTEQVMTVDGWFDTGDLAILSLHDEIVLKGRVKDTIVLRGGENIEPVPIEQKLAQSIYIKQAVVVGQDKRYLAALLLVNTEEVKGFAAENGIMYDTFDNLLASEDIQRLFENEVSSRINAKNGFKMFERINRFALLTKPFEVGVELSAKQDIMRPRIMELYAQEIAELFSEK
ncbi:MAG: long-chain fatty acid--CoA ligase [Treponema sp.]|nr:long-chain fatty acid--CoA ligase [Treponema sp.]